MKESLLTFTKSTVNECLGRTPIIIGILDLPGVMSKARQRQLRKPIPCDICIIHFSSRWHDGPSQSPSKMFDHVFCLTSTGGICCMIVYYVCSMECKWMRPLEFTSSLFLDFSELWLRSKGFGNQCVFLGGGWATCKWSFLEYWASLVESLNESHMQGVLLIINDFIFFHCNTLFASVLSRCWYNNIGLITSR